MTTQVLTGLLLLVLPVAYNLLYTLLARSFDYPDILRQPTDQVLDRFAAGGGRLVLIWWGFAMSAVLLAPAVVLVSATLADADPAVLALATAIGLLAALAIALSRAIAVSMTWLACRALAEPPAWLCRCLTSTWPAPFLTRTA